VTESLEAAVREKFPESVLGFDDFRETAILRVARAKLHEIAAYLRDELAFDMLMDIASIDWSAYEEGPEERFGLIYNLFSSSKFERIQLAITVPEEEPVAATITDLFPGANWFEREAFDLMGIEFSGHPDLRRILTHAGFEGHPLRKDYEASKRQPFTAPPLVVGVDHD